MLSADFRAPGHDFMARHPEVQRLFVINQVVGQQRFERRQARYFSRFLKVSIPMIKTPTS
jgi:hypothetical protein